MKAWWIYQRERFPLLAYLPLVVVFSTAISSYALVIVDVSENGRPAFIGLGTLLALAFFMLLRISDEFKDYADDCQFRPYRAVPRGVVSLPQLGRLAVLLLIGQLAMVVWIDIYRLPLLLLIWAYLLAMHHEFYNASWLKQHPVIYLFSHMLIMPLIGLGVLIASPLSIELLFDIALWPIYALTFMTGLLLEIGRKLRAVKDEEAGVETYTVLWGGNAVIIWLGILIGNALLAGFIASQLDLLIMGIVICGTFIMVSLLFVGLFMNHYGQSSAMSGKVFELLSSAWILVTYGVIIYGTNGAFA